VHLAAGVQEDINADGGSTSFSYFRKKVQREFLSGTRCVREIRVIELSG
jgi:hypothetical protein